MLEQVEVQLPLVLEVVKQQALGHPRPLGDGVGGGLFKAARPEFHHGTVSDEILPFLWKVEEFLIHGCPSSPPPYCR